MANLRQTGSLREYVRAYQKLMLDVPKMPEKDKLNWFIIGLRSWAQADVERSDPKTLEQAYVVAERLADTQRKSYTETFKSTRESDHNGKEERRERSGSSFQRQTGGRQFFRKDYSGPLREVTCWVCGERHEARVCPKRVRPTGQANVARATEVSTSRSSANALQGGDVEESRIGALQLLHTLTKEEETKMILGMEFLCASKMVPMSHLRSVSIMDERHPCMVPVVPTRKDKGKAVVASTIQQRQSGDSKRSLSE
ncbi:hypothetical protein EJ110_NYTH44265 [Nymphaea thermarum]|nr:hypothetical protein EJ110_NYTH44265 [Nymphaea thermarum]